MTRYRPEGHAPAHLYRHALRIRRHPVLLPRRGRIAYGRGDGTGHEELYVMQADGSEKRPLIGELPDGRRVYGTHLAWSPSGDRVAFQRCITCNFSGSSTQLFVADLESGRVDTLTDWSSDSKFPTWSPDGEEIAFVSNRAYVDADSARYRTDLYVMDADGSNVRRLTSSGRAGPPKWSPTGEKIAIEHQHKPRNVFLYDFATGESMAVTDLEFGGRSAWQHDGERLLVGGIEFSGKGVFQLFSAEGDLLRSVQRPEGLGLNDWYTE